MMNGLWGISNVRNRSLANFLFKTVTNQHIVGYFGNKESSDQFMLEQLLFSFARTNSTTHDSYSCEKFGGDPWPSQRPSSGICFVGCRECCNEKGKKYELECPLECRPKIHQDWIYCWDFNWWINLIFCFYLLKFSNSYVYLFIFIDHLFLYNLILILIQIKRNKFKK